jgi:hypothetical protein
MRTCVRMPPRYSEAQAREAIAASLSYNEALRRLGMRPAGGNWKTLKRYACQVWGISVDHFDRDAAQHRGPPKARTPLAEILVEGSTYGRSHLKRRLYEAGLKKPECELCGQGEIWRGRRMALILDHINGVGDDHRLENLRIVCPNCAATLETHCGRNNRRPRVERSCQRCGVSFVQRFRGQRYCSRACGSRWERTGQPRPAIRRVERPPYKQLMKQIAATSYVAVGRRYGVSDNAIRKWVRQYEWEAGIVREGPAGGLEERRGAGVRVPGPAGEAGGEVDAADPVVVRGAGGVAGEDGFAGGGELVAAGGAGDERVEVGGLGEERGVADPGRLLVLGDAEEERVGMERAGGEGLEDLALEAAEAGAGVGQLLEQALEPGHGGPRARVG